MAIDTRLSILVLASHPLLGEGVSRMLAAEPGVEVQHVDCAERDRVAAALAAHPRVVVVERCATLDAKRVLDIVPDALVFDIDIGPGPTWVYRRQEIPGDPRAILELVRLLRRGHPVIAFDAPPRSGHPVPSVPTRG
jgi:DNA-binding NarL/FixJ family response regulator